MTAVLEIDAPSTAAPPRPRRRAWLRAVIAVVLLGLMGAGIGALVYVNTYQPLGAANVSIGGTSTPATLKVLTDGISDTQYALFGPQGTTGTTSYTFANNGRHTVHVLGLGAGLGAGHFVAQAQWARPSARTPGPGHAFPVTLEPGQMLIVKVTFRQPLCSGGISYTLSNLLVRFTALGVHHRWSLGLGGSGGGLPVVLCAPHSALRYADPHTS